MSPFLVYLLLMADDIKEFLGDFMVFFIAASIFAGCFWIGASIWNLVAGNYYESCPEGGKLYVNFAEQSKQSLKASLDTSVLFKSHAAKVCRWLFPITLLVSMGACFMPTTKTVAAMIVLPKITSPQALDAMGAEARDLYKLAKQGLEKLVAENKPAKVEEKPADAKKDDSK